MGGYRTDCYGRGLALHGDKTTTGATILSTLPNCTEYGRAVVRVGDRTTNCPKCSQSGVIVDGEPRSTWHGASAAVDRSIVRCGCPPGTNKVIAPAGQWLGQGPSPEQQAWEKRTAEIAAAAAIRAAQEAVEQAKRSMPVFAKSGERGPGNTEAGTTDESHYQFGHLSYGLPAQLEAAKPEPEQHAQAAKRKPASGSNKPEADLPWYKRMFGGKADAPAQAGMPLAIPVATGGGAELAAAGMSALRGLINFARSGAVFINPVTVGVVGTFYSSKLNAGEDDMLAGSQLAALAGKSAPTRIRFQWVNDNYGRLKPVAYHTGVDSGLDQVRVRSMERNRFTGNYEFWADGADKPTIVWTPGEVEFKAPTNTGNRDAPYLPSTITVLPLPSAEEVGSTSTSLPIPDEKSFDDYILVNLPHGMPPIYIYLSKPPTKFLEVELYSDFKGRPREGMHADHMPSAAAVRAYYADKYPYLDKAELDALAKDVAAVIIPADVHQQDSETYGGRNSPAQIAQDKKDLYAAANRNFDALEAKLKAKGATESELDAARVRMHKINKEQGLYDK